jgi:hypothetical protein
VLFPFHTLEVLMRTLRELAQEALIVQDACNPLGVTKGYATALSDLREALAAAGLPCDTQSLCSHPVNRLWASKVHDLASMGFSDSDRYGDAYRWCRQQSVATAVLTGEAVAA